MLATQEFERQRVETESKAEELKSSGEELSSKVARLERKLQLALNDADLKAKVRR